MLPDGNGAEVLAYIRQHNLPIRVAIVTAAGPGEYWDEALRHAPDALLKKPWHLDELRAWLAVAATD
jgi:CheY-like chemotaxis protein